MKKGLLTFFLYSVNISNKILFEEFIRNFIQIIPNSERNATAGHSSQDVFEEAA